MILCRASSSRHPLPSTPTPLRAVSSPWWISEPLESCLVVHQQGTNFYSRGGAGEVRMMLFLVGFQAQVCMIKSDCFREQRRLSMRAEMSPQNDSPRMGVERSGCVTCLGDEPPM